MSHMGVARDLKPFVHLKTSLLNGIIQIFHPLKLKMKKTQ